ncbi:MULTISPECIES: alpha/beta hydrolase [Fictibacillus]|uniref:Alpha/beta hydrolase-fold protein n=1 Tax=Fictibacillus terranigra TaxID=3058424 RepID=A0ABT8E6W0_9BACL|nr:alpha/beta hydrolase-fold protein [Fictibacillus sp. CENA-BCM004]MDN4073646.1 alpha/beta hydrolase-fold protein [Fictibacillus sp. CENA-BCM004]
MSTFQGTVYEETIHSKELKEDLTLLVYLPPAFTTLKKYPVLIAQDGPDYFQLGRLASLADEMIQKTEIEEMVIIGISHKRGEDRYHKYHPRGEKHHAYIRFMSLELPSYVHEKFNTFLLGSGMCLLGDSLGGYVSLTCGISFPRTFSKIIVQSPFVSKQFLEDIRSFTAYELLTVYHSVGNAENSFTSVDGTTKDFLTPNRELSDWLLNKGFDYRYEEFEGNHLWSDWQANLRAALEFIYGK